MDAGGCAAGIDRDEALESAARALPQWAVGQQLAKVSEREQQLLKDPKELEVRALFKARADEIGRASCRERVSDTV